MKIKHTDFGSETIRKEKAINTKKGEEFWFVQEVVNLGVTTLN